jgi:hypothetical protein
MRRTILVGMLVIVGVGLALPAHAICPHTKVKDLSAVCLDKNCPPGLQAYFATIVNRFPHKLYVTYAFRSGKRQSQIIPGGLELQANSEISQPIGIGRTALPKETQKKRLRILECGTDPKIRYKWRRR